MLQLPPHIVAFSQQDKHSLQGLSAVGAGSIAQAIAWRQQPVILDLSHNQLEGTGGLHDTFPLCNAAISHDWDRAYACCCCEPPKHPRQAMYHVQASQRH